MEKESELSEENKSFLHDHSLVMIGEIQDNISQLMNVYKQNPTFPVDFYNLSMRKDDIEIHTIIDVYKCLTGEDLQ